MKYYQAVCQTDAHGFHVVYSKNIWKTEEEAKEYLYELAQMMGEGFFMYIPWVRDLFLDEGL